MCFVDLFRFSYEPELHPGVTYKLKTPKATLKIFSTGSITVTGTFINFLENGKQLKKNMNFTVWKNIKIIIKSRIVKLE